MKKITSSSLFIYSIFVIFGLVSIYGIASAFIPPSSSPPTANPTETIAGSRVSGNISGNAINVTGTVAIGNGGTGATTANAALNNLLPSQTGNSGKFITTDGTNSSWAAVTGGIGGGGTLNYISKFTASGTIGNSQIFDDGNYVTIGNPTPTGYKLDVAGDININPSSSAYLYDGVQALKLAKGTEAYYTNTFVGLGAGNSTATRQTALGYQAGLSNTGVNQTAIGYAAGQSNIGASQTAIGYAAGQSNTGASQTALGYKAGYSNAGDSQTALGYEAGNSNTGASQTALGFYAGVLNTGGYQTALGMYAGQSNIGNYQTALGYNAGYRNTGSSQTALGYNAGYQNTGARQTALGYQAGNSNTGANQTAIGTYAGLSNIGVSQTALGYLAGYLNTGNQVAGIGYEATRSNTANDVVAIGYQAGKGNAIANQFIIKQANINAVPLIQGDFTTGNVGIGTTSPTAVLHIKAGTATPGTAPFKFTSGTLLTTPEAGAIEYLTDTFYIRGTDKLSATQYKLSALNTAPLSASDTGTLGEIRVAADYIYVAINTNVWVRASLSTW